MNNQGHALTAGLGFMLAAPYVAEMLDRSIGGWELACGGLVAAGAGLLPDVDHPGATIARTFGRPGHFICKWIGRMAGGHRGLTHRILFPVAAGAAVAFAAARWEWAAAVVVALVSAWALRSLGPDLGVNFAGFDVDALALGALTGWATATYLEPGWWLPAAVAVGALIHLAGDKAFGGRSPLRVGGRTEQVLVWALSTAAPVIVLVQTGVLAVTKH